MIEIDVPGSGLVSLAHLVSDFTGTLSFDGKLIPGVKDRLNELSAALTIHVITSDTFGTARQELKEVNCEVHVLDGDGHGKQKKEYVDKLGPAAVIAFGNGRNDREMLAAAGIGVAVVEREGCAVEALTAADLQIAGINNGLDLLLHPKRLKATLRR